MFILLVPVEPILFILVDEPNPEELPNPLDELDPNPLEVDVDVPPKLLPPKLDAEPVVLPNPLVVDEPNVEDPFDETFAVVADAFPNPPPNPDVSVVATVVLPAGNCVIVGSLANAAW